MSTFVLLIASCTFAFLDAAFETADERSSTQTRGGQFKAGRLGVEAINDWTSAVQGTRAGCGNQAALEGGASRRSPACRRIAVSANHSQVVPAAPPPARFRRGVTGSVGQRRSCHPRGAGYQHELLDEFRISATLLLFRPSRLIFVHHRAFGSPRPRCRRKPIEAPYCAVMPRSTIIRGRYREGAGKRERLPCGRGSAQTNVANS